MDEDSLVSTAEACYLGKVARSTLNVHLNMGLLPKPVIKRSNKNYWSKAQIDKWLIDKEVYYRTKEKEHEFTFDSKYALPSEPLTDEEIRISELLKQSWHALRKYVNTGNTSNG